MAKFKRTPKFLSAIAAELPDTFILGPDGGLYRKVDSDRVQYASYSLNRRHIIAVLEGKDPTGPEVTALANGGNYSLPPTSPYPDPNNRPDLDAAMAELAEFSSLIAPPAPGPVEETVFDLPAPPAFLKGKKPAKKSKDLLYRIRIQHIKGTNPKSYVMWIDGVDTNKWFSSPEEAEAHALSVRHLYPETPIDPRYRDDWEIGPG